MEFNKKKEEVQANADTGKKGKINWNAWLELCFLAILAYYPLRHVNMGGDLWDIGYNYGNFAYFDLNRIGKTWFFSTYLASAVGHLLTFLPYGHTVLGLNAYTALFSSGLAVMGYLFCVRKLKFSPIITFFGEILALSMCWCPTALLYNYLTYLLFFACVILLYLGLSRKKAWMLAAAGACLGTNVFVRFSNLPEMGLILAVWAYYVWDAWEGRKATKETQTQREKREAADKASDAEKEKEAADKASDAEKEAAGKEGCEENPDAGRKGTWIGQALVKTGRGTLWCLLGYLAALAVGFGWIALRYGLGEYVSGIQGLFAMTETATDYKPYSMIRAMVWQYKEALNWVIRLAFFAVLASAIVAITDHVPACIAEKNRKTVRSICNVLGVAGVACVTVFMTYWAFYQRADQPNLTSFYYSSYDPIYWPGTLFLMLGMGIGFLEMVRKGNDKESRFLGMTVILVTLLTSLGSNNGIYPSMNNMFLLAPYVLWKLAKFALWAFAKSWKKPETMSEMRFNFMPVAVTVWAFVLICGMQFFLFGRYFVFCEGTGMQETGVSFINNKALSGIKMSLKRAMILSDLNIFANAEGLPGQEVILHGKIPALAFYLQMPPAFHSWNDLDSFSYETMQKTMEELMRQISEEGRAKPVVIAARTYAEYGPIAPDGEEAVSASPDNKWELIRRFMGLYGYEQTFENEMFAVWQAKE